MAWREQKHSEFISGAINLFLSCLVSEKIFLEKVIKMVLSGKSLLKGHIVIMHCRFGIYNSVY